MLTYEFLQAASEPPRGTPAPGSLESYRLIVWGSGWIRETVIRFERHHNADLDEEWAKADPHLTLGAHRFSLVVHRAGDDGRPVTTRVEIDDERWQCLLVLLRAARFWELPEKGGNSGGMDAACYELEGFNGERAHRVIRHSPDLDRDRELFALPCRYLWDLAALAELGA